MNRSTPRPHPGPARPQPNPATFFLPESSATLFRFPESPPERRPQPGVPPRSRAVHCHRSAATAPPLPPSRAAPRDSPPLQRAPRPTSPAGLLPAGVTSTASPRRSRLLHSLRSLPACLESARPLSSRSTEEAPPRPRAGCRRAALDRRRRPRARGHRRAELLHNLPSRRQRQPISPALPCRPRWWLTACPASTTYCSCGVPCPPGVHIGLTWENSKSVVSEPRVSPMWTAKCKAARMRLNFPDSSLDFFFGIHVVHLNFFCGSDLRIHVVHLILWKIKRSQNHDKNMCV